MQDCHGKVQHDAACNICTNLATGQQATEPSAHYDPSRSFYGGLPSPNETFADSISSSSVPGTPVSSVASSEFDSRRSSADTTGLRSQHARSPNLSGRSGHGTEGDGVVERNDNEKGEGKSAKEQAQRDAHSNYLRTMEDIIELLCGIHIGSSQSSGNRTASGLTITKDQIYEIGCTMLCYLANKNLEEAITKGDTNLHFAELRQVKEKLNYPTQGTVMDDGNAPPCSFGRNEKGKKRSRRCKTHDQPDYIECRKERKRRLRDRKIQQREESHRSCLSNLSLSG